MKKIKWGSWLLALAILIPLLVGVYYYFHPIPDHYSQVGAIHQTDDVEFLRDLSYADQAGELNHDQEIFDHVFQVIDEAEEFIVIDMFLFSDDYDHEKQSFPSLSKELVDRLVAKKRRSDIPIIFITDPLNSFYRTYEPENYERMRDVGIELVETDLLVLPDSNPVYSGFYRTYFQWFAPSRQGYLPNVFRPMGPRANIMSYLQLLNFKANHRKTIVSDQEAMVISANPHDGSAWHSNIGLAVKGQVQNDLLTSEQAVYQDAGGNNPQQFADFSHKIQTESDTDEGQYKVQLLSEEKIKDKLLQVINQAKAGDQLQMGLFYLSDRDIVTALKKANQRGALIQIILDVNQDAFGKQKIGIPNKVVAQELLDASDNLQIRWYQSHGEQYHAKFLHYKNAQETIFIGGSANFTKRNLGDFNLETDLAVTAPNDSEFAQAVASYYQTIWTNAGGNTYTVAYDHYAEDKWWKTVIYHLQERLGLSSF
ncbi:phospholipase D family protein [Aerococcus kribbianus]|uniref:Phospholipase D family protein n=1 Tax=Aerococcus kribbianus TaxID=2999064 RepID=A0A9X3FNF7_9LACT|nr:MULTISPECIES: phospholipase D family protein [unclassified Aerococcus]MCZ0717778.1 phospholipase D family protein [Aerococcus sp. YH-aer221]MCZ0726065.1 phospholipase D family protein [Aerococcus sp. YH-aer222]